MSLEPKWGLIGELADDSYMRRLAAWALLFKADRDKLHQRYMLRLRESRVAPLDTADQLTERLHDKMVDRLQKGPLDFRAPEAYYVYLMKAHNSVYASFWRERKRYPRTPMESYLNWEEGKALLRGWTASPYGPEQVVPRSPEQMLVERENRKAKEEAERKAIEKGKQIRRLLMEMSEPVIAIAAVLRFMGGFSASQTAALLGVHRSSVYRYLTEARTKIEAKLLESDSIGTLNPGAILFNPGTGTGFSWIDTNLGKIHPDLNREISKMLGIEMQDDLLKRAQPIVAILFNGWKPEIILSFVLRQNLSWKILDGEKLHYLHGTPYFHREKVGGRFEDRLLLQDITPFSAWVEHKYYREDGGLASTDWMYDFSKGKMIFRKPFSPDELTRSTDDPYGVRFRFHDAANAKQR